MCYGVTLTDFILIEDPIIIVYPTIYIVPCIELTNIFLFCFSSNFARDFREKR